ncbi:Eco57I restriction-modification methylase domain-containing protein [Ignavigranum ruoffiae]
MSETTLLRSNRRILDNLLSDRTTNKNIRWGTDNYSYLGSDYSEDREIKVDLITGWHDGLIQPRADKANDVQLARTRNRAEVFTPSWIVEKQVNAVIDGMLDIDLEQFLSTKWLEITCGEGPYMVNRYDMISGNIIPLKERAGFIDRKFRRLNQEIEDFNEWLRLAIIIYQSSYGYEYQGDSLLLARENLLLTFMDNFFYMFGAVPPEDVQLHITDIISKNVFQMDGLTYQVPYSDDGRESVQLSLFEEIEEGSKEPMEARIYLWNKKQTVNFKDLMGGSSEMKFDVVIGNPPFHEDDNDSGKGSAKPKYHHFINAVKGMSPEKICLIVPSVWFTGGKGLNNFRKRMLKDIHLKTIINFITPKEIFVNANLRGGVNYFVWDRFYNNSSKGIFTKNILHGETLSEGMRPLVYEDTELLIIDNKAIPILKKINKKVGSFSDGMYLDNIVSARNPFGFPTSFKNKPEFKRNFESFSDPVKIYASKGAVGYVERKDIKKNIDWVSKWKIFTPFANNVGTDLNDDNINFIIGEPNSIVTETYLVFGVGLELNETQASNIGRYLQTYLVRYLISLAKANQNGTRNTYQFVPLIDFKSDTQVKWSSDDLDGQLFDYFELNNSEIKHVKKVIKEMV